MARLSKTTPFQIHNDNADCIPTPDNATNEHRKEHDHLARPFAWAGGKKDDGFVTESDDEAKGRREDGAQEGDDEKNYTRTSISSFPESSYPTDFEHTPMHKPYTPTYARPSTRRLPMSSPLRKGKLGTPQSDPRGSPRTKRREFDSEEHEAKQAPLVLLHITALPVNIPWNIQTMREVLPQHVMDNVQLLKSNLSDTVLKRGILIPHPREDYELLEERLLETLELQEPRISKCGHFRNRHSTSSNATNGSESADSGVGSSVDGTDEDHCSTCHHHLQAAGSGKQKWSIKVFASNGLMRASAWSAAWSEMERVDVEIMPWIKDELRFKLDEMKTEKHTGTDELRINRLVEERIRLLEEDGERARQAAMSREIDKIVLDEQRQNLHAARPVPMACIEAAKPNEPEQASAPAPAPTSTNEPASTELPNIYRPKQIPLSILIRNYVFLLARKPGNMAAFFLIIIVSWLYFTLGPAGVHASVSELSMHAHAKIKAFQDVSVPFLLGEAASNESDPFPEVRTGSQDASRSDEEHQVLHLVVEPDSTELVQDPAQVFEEPYVETPVAELDVTETVGIAFETEQSYTVASPVDLESAETARDFEQIENPVHNDEYAASEEVINSEIELPGTASDTDAGEEMPVVVMKPPAAEYAVESGLPSLDESSEASHGEEQELETGDIAAELIDEVTSDAPELPVGLQDAADSRSDDRHNEQQQEESGAIASELTEEALPGVSKPAVDVESHDDGDEDYAMDPDNADDATTTPDASLLPNDVELEDLDQSEGYAMPEQGVCLKQNVFSRPEILDVSVTLDLPQVQAAAQCVLYSISSELLAQCSV